MNKDIPPICRQLEMLGLPERIVNSKGERGGIPAGKAWDGYTIGWRAMRLVRHDLKVFYRNCNPGEKYVKRCVQKFIEHEKIVIDRTNPWIIQVKLKEIPNEP